MTTSLTKALSDTQRSYLAAKASMARVTDQLLARGPEGSLVRRQDLTNATEQLRHFRGWVYASIRPIAQRIAGQRVQVGRSVTVSTQKQAPDLRPFDSHPLLDLLNDPNDLMVSWSLMYVTVASLEMTGRQLWWVAKGKQILPIPTPWIFGMEGASRISAFLIRPPGHAGEPIRLPAEEVVYFCYPTPADPHGCWSPLQACAAAVDADESIQHSQVEMFKHGIFPSHAITVGRDPHPEITGGVRPRLTAPQQRQIIAAIRKRYEGVHNHGEPIILDGLIEDVKRLSLNPNEMDWLQSGQMTKDRIVQAFGVNPILLGQVEGANRASATVADRHFVETTVNPKIELMSQTLTEWLSPMFGGDIRVWIEPAQPNDSELELKWTELLAKFGAISGAEMRRLSGLDLPDDAQYIDPVATGSQTDNKALALLKEMIEQLKLDQLTAQSADELLRRIELPLPSRGRQILETNRNGDR